MKINLYIDHLVLEGIECEERHHGVLQVATETELKRRLDEGGLSSRLLSGGGYGTLRGGSVDAGAAQGPDNLGQQIGRAITRAIQQ